MYDYVRRGERLSEHACACACVQKGVLVGIRGGIRVGVRGRVAQACRRCLEELTPYDKSLVACYSLIYCSLINDIYTIH